MQSLLCDTSWLCNTSSWLCNTYLLLPINIHIVCLFSQSSQPLTDGTASQLPYPTLSSGGRRWASPQSSLLHCRAHSADPDIVLEGERRAPSQDEVGSYLQALEEQLVELKELTGMEDEAAMYVG